MHDGQPPRRKRVSALVPLDQYERLEEMAKEGQKPISLIVARIIRKFLCRRDDPDALDEPDSNGDPAA